MSSTSPQVPPIESLAPPLPDAKSGAATQSPVKDEPWVSVDAQDETTNSNSTTSDPPVKIQTGADQTSTLFSRVMKQRSTAMPQTAHVQKDNTLAIFVTLCLVVVAIACGIYFVADRETQNQADHATTATQNEVIAPPAQQAAVTSKQQTAQNPLFGKPATQEEKKKAPVATTATVTAPKLSKTDRLVQDSQTKLSSMRYIEAEYSAQRATELSPASGNAWLALGRALYSQGRYSEAEKAFKTCIKRDAQSKAASSAADFMSQLPASGQTK